MVFAPLKKSVLCPFAPLKKGLLCPFADPRHAARASLLRHGGQLQADECWDNAAAPWDLADKWLAGEQRRAVQRFALELELELIQTQMTQKPMLRVEVGARALRNQTGGGRGGQKK